MPRASTHACRAGPPHPSTWVAEFGGQRATVFSPDGACLGTWGGPGRQVPGLNRSWGLALAPQGRVWLLDSGADRAYLLSRSVVLAGPGAPAPAASNRDSLGSAR